MPLMSCRQRPGGRAGFTLLELIVVSALIGILLTLSVPSLRMAFFTDPLKSSARQIIGLVNGVRELAVREQRPYLLHFSQIEKRIWYEVENGNEEEVGKNPRKREFRLPAPVSISGVWMVEGEVSQDQSVIWVTKQGYMRKTLVKLEDDRGENINIQFFPFLDSVAIVD